jgi:hypothetical protein
MNLKKITRAILGITISLSVASFTTGTRETPAIIEKAEQPNGYMMLEWFDTHMQ